MSYLKENAFKLSRKQYIKYLASMRNSMVVICAVVLMVVSNATAQSLLGSTVTSGGTGDNTDVVNPQLKLVAPAGYIRVPHKSTDVNTSVVFNFEANKNVYWGEASDNGTYYFRGRNVSFDRNMTLAGGFNVSGNVGIGTANPNQKLTVNGTIYGKEVKVDLNVPGPDYVFLNTYSLRSLAEVEDYIKTNQHLPEVPSAAQMEKEGINVSEMNMLLLKKVEELTLYVIDLQKQVSELKKGKL